MLKEDVAAPLVLGHDVPEIVVGQLVGADGADLLERRRAEAGLAELGDASSPPRCAT